MICAFLPPFLKFSLFSCHITSLITSFIGFEENKTIVPAMFVEFLIILMASTMNSPNFSLVFLFLHMCSLLWLYVIFEIMAGLNGVFLVKPIPCYDFDFFSCFCRHVF